MFEHAGEIDLQAGDRTAAERYLRQAADLNSIGSEQARVTWPVSRCTARTR